MLGELWWTRLVNSVRFLDAVKDELFNGKSVVMSFDNEIPWQDFMVETLEQQLSFLTETHMFKIHDVSDVKDKPGEFLFKNYCSEYDRTHNYWPSMTYEAFLASNQNSPLKHRVVCISGVTSANANAWLKTVNDYLDCCNDEEHGVFVLITQGMPTASSKYVETVRYTDYVSEYDCLMLCMTVLSSEKCTPEQKRYVSEAASSIARGNIHVAGALASAGYQLALSPYETASYALRECDVKIISLHERVKVGIWKTQIKLVFPKLEDFRREIIIKYKTKLQEYLPITSSSGERVDKATDLELGQLYFICGKSSILEKKEFEMLKKMREARNKLAHQDVLTITQLKELNIL